MITLFTFILLFSRLDFNGFYTDHLGAPSPEEA